MKKLLSIALTALVLAGCGGGSSEKKQTVCTLTSEKSGFKTEVKTTLEHTGATVDKQTQNAVITVGDETSAKSVYEQLKKVGFEEKTKDMTGVEYKLAQDKTTVTEDVIIDVTKISGKDYSVLTNNQVESTAGSIKIDFEKTVSGFESQGYTCKGE